MSHLSPPFAACFGLTCARFYAEFKRQHKSPVKLETLLWDPEEKSVDSADHKKKLYHLIGGWIMGGRQCFYHDMYLVESVKCQRGTNYISKERSSIGGRFLSTDVYAPSSWSKTNFDLIRLREAYAVYIGIVQEVDERYPRLIPRYKSAPPIPSPCGMGNDWFIVFFNALLTDWYLSEPVNIKFTDLKYRIHQQKDEDGEIISRVSGGLFYRVVTIEDFIAMVLERYKPIAVNLSSKYNITAAD